MKTIMKQTMPLLLIFIFILISLRCDTTEPPPSKASLSLTLEDVSCTEAWLTLKVTDIQLPASVVLKQNDQTRATLNLSTGDTLLYVDSLLPKQTYAFQVTSIQHQVSSNQANATTLDTTSHNFTWQTFTFGQHSSSVLYDVAIIDENNIWAVGEIYMKDSLGNNDPHAYNAVHWDGNEWKLHRIMFYTICGQTSLSSYPAKAIFAFSENDIWIAGGGRQLARINGMNQVDKICLPFSMVINRLWGSSSPMGTGNDLYAVGDGGNIAHYQNGSWRKIESGTDLNFRDVYGTINHNTNKDEIIAVCSRNNPLSKAIYKIEDNTALELSTNPIQWELFSCWFVPNKHYYLVGSGIYEKIYLSENKWKNQPLDITHYGTIKVRGNEVNDVFVVGSFGEFLHFNGYSWKSYINEMGSFNGSYYSVFSKNQLAVSVGYSSNKAIISVVNK